MRSMAADTVGEDTQAADTVGEDTRVADTVWAADTWGAVVLAVALGMLAGRRIPDTLAG